MCLQVDTDIADNITAKYVGTFNTTTAYLKY